VKVNVCGAASLGVDVSNDIIKFSVSHVVSFHGSFGSMRLSARSSSSEMPSAAAGTVKKATTVCVLRKIENESPRGRVPGWRCGGRGPR
jgi:hypothetical protein